MPRQLRAVCAGEPMSQQRSNTDADLEHERARTDHELGKPGAAEAQADAAIARARQRSDAQVSAARARLDASRLDEDLSALEYLQRETERKAQDAAVDRERAATDANLESQRTERRLHVAGLLAAERAMTDASLRAERLHADELAARRSAFLAMVAHDAGGLLMTMAMSLDSLSPENIATSSVRAHVKSLGDATALLRRLIKDLADLASIESGKFSVRASPVNLLPLLADLAESFGPVAEQRRIALKLELPVKPLVASVDAERIFQVAANLLTNAFKFSDPGGQVTLTLAEAPGEVRITVEDRGLGIAPEHQQLVFEAFRTLGPPGRGGTGLGLFISRSIAEAHGGRIELQSKLGRGSTFALVLPRSV